MEYVKTGTILGDLLACREQLLTLDLLILAGMALGVVLMFVLGWLSGDRSVGRGLVCALAYAYCLAAAYVLAQKLLYEGVGPESFSDLQVILYTVAGVGALAGVAAACSVRLHPAALLGAVLLAPIVEVAVGFAVYFGLALLSGAFDQSWPALIVLLAMFAGTGGSVVVIIIGD